MDQPALIADSPQSVVEEAYRLISFGPGGEPSWAPFRALFADHAVLALRLFPGDAAISVMNLDAYVEQQVRDEMRKEGYEERIGEARYDTTGDVAEAHVRFQMIFGPDRIHDAVDIFQLVRVDGAWRIVSIISEVSS